MRGSRRRLAFSAVACRFVLTIFCSASLFESVPCPDLLLRLRRGSSSFGLANNSCRIPETSCSSLTSSNVKSASPFLEFSSLSLNPLSSGKAFLLLFVEGEFQIKVQSIEDRSPHSLPGRFSTASSTLTPSSRCSNVIRQYLRIFRACIAEPSSCGDAVKSRAHNVASIAAAVAEQKFVLVAHGFANHARTVMFIEQIFLNNHSRVDVRNLSFVLDCIRGYDGTCETTRLAVAQT